MGISEAHGVLDSIRAAQRFEGAGTSARSKSVVWGHSQGGGAALVTAELATPYAPDANLVGVVARSPAAELKLFEPVLKDDPSKGYIMMAAAGLKAAYPEVDLSGLFTPAGLKGVQLATTSCFGANNDTSGRREHAVHGRPWQSNRLPRSSPRTRRPSARAMCRSSSTTARPIS